MWNWMMLGLESNRVIGLRMAKLMRGDKAAQREARRMVSEKMLAAAKAGTSLMAGASGDKIIEQYRRKVQQTPNGSAANEHGANENHADLSAGLTCSAALTAHNR
ncbi:hypothetical protein [Bradyrhizobium valentinum]|uniref:hypothetical protein n=1 Tax=Bradyrhizobium valentinum TaxID=1518501 RepID=UPI000A4B72C1